MTARAHPTLGVRPFLPADAPLLAEIFRASIEELTGEDYSEGQQQAWAAAAEDDDAFVSRLSERLTVVATMEGSPVGFACLEGPEHLDMLYVHPAAAGQGVGTLLCDALEKIAAGRVRVEYLSENEPIKLNVVAGFEQAIMRFTTDIPYLTNWGAPLLVGAGSILVAHTAEERVSKRELVESVEIYARLARTLLARADETDGAPRDARDGANAGGAAR